MIATDPEIGKFLCIDEITSVQHPTILRECGSGTCRNPSALRLPFPPPVVLVMIRVPPPRPYLDLALLLAGRLRVQRRCFPTPLAEIVARNTHLSRLGEHDHSPFVDNESGPRPPPRSIHLMYNSEDPNVNHNPPVGSQVEAQTWTMANGALIGQKRSIMTLDV